MFHIDKDAFLRYQSHLTLDWFGFSGQLKLKNAKVLCVGAGGLASPLLFYLTAAGLGVIGIIDHDKVCLSNLTRQILFTTDCIGMYKVVAAKQCLEKLNSSITLKTYTEKLQADSARDLFQDYDFIIDCSDNFKTKLIINDVCFQLSKSFVTASANQNSGNMAIFNGQGGPCYRCLFESLDINTGQSCHETGVFSPLLGILGSLQAIETIKHLTNSSCNYQQLITVDALTLEQKKYQITINPACAINHGTAFCRIIKKKQVKEIECLAALGQREFLLLDVRSQVQHQKNNLGGSCIPLEELPSKFASLSPSIPVVLYCQSGKRSRMGCEFLQDLGYEVYSITGGLEGLKNLED